MHTSPSNMDSNQLDIAYLSAETTPAERVELAAEIYRRKYNYRRAQEQVTISIEV